MSTFTSPEVRGDMQSKQLANLVAEVLDELDWLLNGNIDFKNIRAKSITANLINVDVLSAISANLGHITAGTIDAVDINGSTITGGIITGALIQTARTGIYPRSEMRSDTNLFSTYQDENNYIVIRPNISGAPGVSFVRHGTPIGFINASGTNNIQLSANGAVNIGAGSTLTLSGFGGVYVQSFSNFYQSSSPGSSLQNILNSKANAFSGYSGVVSSGSQSLTFSNGILIGVS